jgi:hypothetical protein
LRLRVVLEHRQHDLPHVAFERQHLKNLGSVKNLGQVEDLGSSLHIIRGLSERPYNSGGSAAIRDLRRFNSAAEKRGLFDNRHFLPPSVKICGVSICTYMY